MLSYFRVLPTPASVPGLHSVVYALKVYEFMSAMRPSVAWLCVPPAESEKHSITTVYSMLDFVKVLHAWASDISLLLIIVASFGLIFVTSDEKPGHFIAFFQ